MSLRFILLLSVCMLSAACTRDPEPSPSGESGLARDHFSFANTDQFRSRHLELDLTVDFERQVLEGHVIHHIERLDPQADTIVLDGRGLLIEGVQLAPGDGTAVELEFHSLPADEVRGEALQIRLPQTFSSSSGFLLKIEYRTGPESSALMWLPPELTAGGGYPFMFTQSQSIHARSWIPLQDSPLVRTTYEATIRTPKSLLAVMSADNNPLTSRDGEYRFLMPQPIPSYLMALAVGNLYFESFGEDTGVYAEPEVLPAAAFEFADTQAMLDAAEAIYGPYQWGRYDLLILPPSFPFGGMENPRLSFITPSVLAGDRSLVSLIAHELAHSWSGNLVSNRTWRDLWLNEGITSYLDARLMEALYGKDRADEERVLAWRSLVQGLETVPEEMQPLAPVFEDGHPDRGQQGLQYAKGQMFLIHLEALFGRETFDEFLTSYFDHFAFQAISSEEFLDYLEQGLIARHPGVYSRNEAEAWLYSPGLPEEHTIPRSENLVQASSMAQAWSIGELGAGDLPAQTWSPQAVVWFLGALPPGLEEEQLGQLDEAFRLSDSNNAEIARAWFTQVATRGYRPAYPDLRAYLQRHGRTHMILPVYAALAENGQDLSMAREIFNHSKPGYHPITKAAIAPLLDLPHDVDQEED